MEIDIIEDLSFEALLGLHPFAVECEECIPGECDVCLGEHDEEVHAATLRLRARFRAAVTRYLNTEVTLVS